MIKKLIHLSLYAGLLLAAGSCRDEVFSINQGNQQTVVNEGLPLEFEIILPDSPATRAIPDYPKRTFSGGDVIHILGTYNMSDNSVLKRYGAMTYNESAKQWEPLPDKSGEIEVNTLNWPSNCETATFKAYYIYDSDYLLKEGESTPEQLLSGMQGSSKDVPDTDPLQSVNNGEIEYGHTIRLEFEHACSYLNVEEMPAGTTTVFWFTQRESNGNYSPDFKNGYKLTLTENTATGDEDDNQDLKIEFVQMPKSQYGNAVYVEGNATLYTTEEGEERTVASFYLAPGTYKSFVIGYPGSSSMIDYLAYTKMTTDIQDPDDPNPNNEMAANGVYTFNVSKSSGLTMVTPPEEDTWKEDAPPWHKVDAEDFLWAACNGLEYYNNQGVKILEPTATGVKLLCNIDMDFQEYTVFGPNDEKYSATNGYFEPTLDNGKVFDGGHYYIHNLGSPLFRYNNGTIRNVGFSVANLNVVSVESDNAANIEGLKPGFDLSRQGIVCDFNDGGTINNIRMKGGFEDYDPSKTKLGLNLTVSIYATEDSETHNVGAIAGSNTGTINQIEIADDITIDVKKYTGEEIIPAEETFIPTINIGGLVGQNASPGVMINISPLSGLENITSPSITIKNDCEGATGACRIGGAIGANNGGTAETITLPYVSINSTNSSLYQSIIGGLVGIMANGSGSILRSSMVGEGSVLAGPVAPSGDLVSSYSFIGGIAGLIYDTNTVTNSRTVVNVGGTSTYTEGVTYATGGAFGRIDSFNGAGGGLIQDIIANGTNLRGPSNYMGNFAGLVPNGITWNDYASSNIVVKTHYSFTDPSQEIPNIGGSK